MQRDARASRASQWLLALAIGGSALAVGTVHTTTLCIVAAVLLAAAVLSWWDAEPMKARPVATVLLLTGVVLTAYSALQCLPMPISWLAKIAPHNGDVWARALSPLHESGPRWATISLDPIATRIEVLKGATYLLAFLTALRIGRRRDGMAFLSAAVVVTGMVLAATALLHPAFKMTQLFGVYEPGAGTSARHMAPFLNPNNLASYLNVALCLALAATLTPQPRMPRAIMGSVVLLLAATQVWVASRAGVVTMFLGALVVVAVVRATRSPQSGRVATLSLVSGGVAAVGVILVVLGTSEDTSAELLTSDLSKLQMFSRVMRMFPSMPLFGCGRGAFESVFPAFRADVGYVRYTYPENVVAQWILEWGLPVGAAGLAAVAFALRPTAVLSRSTTAAGAWAAIIAVFVQNLGDLGTEIPGLMIAVVVCGAIVVAGSDGRTVRLTIERWGGVPKRIALAAAVSGAAAIAFASTAIGHELTDDRQALMEAAVDRRVATADMHALARAAMLRHPAEPYLPFVTAARATRQRDDNAMPWIAATLERAIVYGPAHQLLAHVIAARSPSQARLEYRLAMEQAPQIGMSSEITRLVGGYFDALEVIPRGGAGALPFEALIDAIKDRLPATTVRLDADLVSRDPTAPGPVLRAARNAVEDIEEEPVAPWCREAAHAGCVRLAIDASKRAEQVAPNACDGYVLQAKARIAIGDVDGGLDDLETAADRISNRVPCMEELVRLALRTKNEGRAQAALERIGSMGCGSNVECARNLTWVAQEEERRGNTMRALAMYKRAHAQATDDDALLEKIASLASAAGLHVEAAEAYDQLAQKKPTESRWEASAAAERSSAIRDNVKF